MSATYPQAIDEIFALFKAAWDANAASIVGSAVPPTIIWKGVEPKDGPPINEFFARIATQQVGEPQSTFKSGVAEDSSRRYTANGLVIVQLFLPMSDSQAMRKGLLLGQMVKEAFRGKSTASCVWFRNARINDAIPPEENLYRLNVIAEYEYDEVG